MGEDEGRRAVGLGVDGDLADRHGAGQEVGGGFLQAGEQVRTFGGGKAAGQAHVEAEILEDLIVAAHNDAKGKIEQLMAEKTQELTAGLPIPPGMKLPF